METIEINSPYRAYLDDYQLITVFRSLDLQQGKSDYFVLVDELGKKEKLEIKESDIYQEYRKYTVTCKTMLEIDKTYELFDSWGGSCILECGLVVKTALFEEQYSYLGDDLGVSYQKETSEFVLWAPTCQEVILRLSKDEKKFEFSLVKEERGIFRLKVVGDWQAYYYNYLLKRANEEVEIVDLYAPSLSANGLYGVIIDPERVKMDLSEITLPEYFVDHIIYEISVRDISSSATAKVSSPATYLGLTEKDTNYQGYPTALAYLKELGVTTIQLMPVVDFGSVDELAPQKSYNWGYDPTHYYCLEGSYSSNPDDGYSRVLEFKTLVKTLHKENLAVSMDLVYNHVFLMEQDNLWKVLPYYFFRINNNREISNGSFCGNEFASDSKMGSKYLVDCCLKWVREYGIDAFRFDLMGLIDKKTMLKIAKAVRTVKPNFMIYGEGWNLPTLLREEEKTTIANQQKGENLAYFSDHFRDIIKGNTKDSVALGYGSGDSYFIEAAKQVIAGDVQEQVMPCYFTNPNHIINYVECHDDQTLWDKLNCCCPGVDKKVLVSKVKLINAIVLLAQGVPFLHSGQEFCRSKNGEFNTYMAGDEINQIDYLRMIDFWEVVQYTKDIIDLRKNTSVFRYQSKEEIMKNASFISLNEGALLYRLSGINEIIDCFINPGDSKISYKYEKEVRILVDEKGYVKEKHLVKNLEVNQFSLVVVSYEK